jgi:hypothetical protein
MIGRPPPPAAPKSGMPCDRLCHSKVAGQDTACRVVEGHSGRYAAPKLRTSVKVSGTEDPQVAPESWCDLLDGGVR